MEQQLFNPIDYGFQWTKDWYEFDGAASRKRALAARNKTAKELKAQGHKVHKFILGGQLITLGGIGSGHPEITLLVSVYGLNWR